MGMFDYVECPKKTFVVHYYSRYFKDMHKMRVQANSKKDIRDHWHSIMETDEFVIKKIEEVA